MKLHMYAGLLAALMTISASAVGDIAYISSLKDVDFDAMPDNACLTVDVNILLCPNDIFILNKRSLEAITLWQSMVTSHPELTQEDWEKVAFTAASSTERRSPDKEFIEAVGAVVNQRGIKAIMVDGYVFALLDKMQVEPQHLVVVDSSVELLKFIGAECEKRGIAFKGYVYDPGIVKEWNESLVRFQLEHVITTNEWLSDEEALELLANQE